MKATLSSLLSLLLLASSLEISLADDSRSLRTQYRGSRKGRSLFTQTNDLSARGLQGSGPVQWDEKSVIIAGQRVFVYAEEFHPFRVPVPGLWRDTLEKIKSGGFNAVSIYTHARLESMNDLEGFLKIAKDVGVWIILRPGPYINAETTNGGIAPWLQNEPGTLRENSTAYTQGQAPYLDAITGVAKRYQVALDGTGKDLDPSSGPIIQVQVENEYSDSSPNRDAYFEDLKAYYRANGITVPLSFNNCCTPARGDFANDVDFYGQDGYPLGFDCRNPTNWGSGVQTSIYDSFEKIKPDQFKYIPEYQGGSFDPYGGPGYDKCYDLVGPDFARVYGQSLLSEGVRAMNYYMGMGGVSRKGPLLTSHC